MKRVGVSGLNGFIGSNFLKYCMEHIPDYNFEIVNISDELENRNSREIAKYLDYNHFDFMVNLTHFPDNIEETKDYNNLLLFWCQMFKIPLLQIIDREKILNESIKTKHNGHFIISTSNVYSSYNDTKSRIRQLYEKKDLPVSNDFEYITNCNTLVKNMADIVNSKTFKDKSSNSFLSSHCCRLSEFKYLPEDYEDIIEVFKEWDKEKEVKIYEIEPIIGNFRSYLDFNSEEILDLILD